MGRKTSKQKQKPYRGSSVYAQTRLPRCDGCGKGFVTLKVMDVVGKKQALCTECQVKTLSSPGTRTMLRQ